MTSKNKKLGKPFSLKTVNQKRNEKILLDVILLLCFVFFISAVQQLIQKNFFITIVILVLSVFLWEVFIFKINKVIKNLKKAGYKITWLQYSSVYTEDSLFWIKGRYEIRFYILRYRKFLNGDIPIRDIGKIGA